MLAILNDDVASLTQTARVSKKTVTVILTAIAIIAAGFVIFTVGNNIVSAILPKGADSAIVAFGKLPTLEMQGGVPASSKLTYSMETISGDLPNLPKLLKVFYSGQTASTFGDLDKAKSIAQTLGFFATPVETIDGQAVFGTLNDPSKLLKISTATLNFSIESDFRNNKQVISTRLGSVEDSMKIADTFIKAFSLPENDFTKDKTTTTFYKIEAGKLAEASSLSSANLVQVNYGRTGIDNLEVYPINYLRPNVWLLISRDNVVLGDKNITNFARHKFSTYPLKGVKKAFDELKAGRGVFNKEFDGNNFVIRDVDLAYLETEKPQGFLQPVYAFKSDDNLLAFVAAVDPAWILGQN